MALGGFHGMGHLNRVAASVSHNCEKVEEGAPGVLFCTPLHHAQWRGLDPCRPLLQTPLFLDANLPPDLNMGQTGYIQPSVPAFATGVLSTIPHFVLQGPRPEKMKGAVEAAATAETTCSSEGGR